MLIRLQCIYIFLLFHAVLLSFLDVLQSFYSNFISFSGTNLLTQCLVVVFCFFYIAGNQYQTESKHRETYCGFFTDQKTSIGPEKHPSGAPRGAQPTRA